MNKKDFGPSTMIRTMIVGNVLRAQHPLFGSMSALFTEAATKTESHQLDKSHNQSVCVCVDLLPFALFPQCLSLCAHAQ